MRFHSSNISVSTFLRRTVMRNTALVTGMVMAFIAEFCVAQPVEAVEILQLKPWPFGESEEVISRLPNLKGRMRWYKERPMGGLWGGYLDLNLDGVDELIVMEGRDECGTGGCWANAYKKKNGNWTYLVFLCRPRGRTFRGEGPLLS